MFPFALSHVFVGWHVSGITKLFRNYHLLNIFQGWVGTYSLHVTYSIIAICFEKWNASVIIYIVFLRSLSCFSGKQESYIFHGGWSPGQYHKLRLPRATSSFPHPDYKEGVYTYERWKGKSLRFRWKTNIAFLTKDGRGYFDQTFNTSDSPLPEGPN